MWKSFILLVSVCFLMSCKAGTKDKQPAYQVTIVSPSPKHFVFHPHKGNLEEILETIKQTHTEYPSEVQVILQYEADSDHISAIKKQIKEAGLTADVIRTSLNRYGNIAILKHADETQGEDCEDLELNDEIVRNFLTRATEIKSDAMTSVWSKNNCAVFHEIEYKNATRSFFLFPTGHFQFFDENTRYLECLDCLTKK